MFQAEAVEEYCFKNGHYSIYTVRLHKKMNNNWKQNCNTVEKTCTYI